MDSKELRNLSEAYLNVYQEIDEAKVEAGASDIAKKDIRSRRFVGSEKEKDYDAMGSSASNWVSASRLRAHKASRGMKKEEVDIYDVILSHLIDEGYASTEEAATAIMVNMSEEWRDSVVEAYKDLPVGKMISQVGKKKFRTGMDVGYGIGKGESNPENEKRRDKYANQAGKMSAVASMHSSEKAKAKSKMKKD